MPVYKDKKRDSYYVSISYVDALGKQSRHVKRGFQTSALAKEYEANYRLSDKIKISNITLGQLTDDFIEYKKQRIKARSIYDINSIINKHIIGYFGNDFLVRKINIHVIQEFQKDLLNKDYSNEYTCSIQTVLSSLMKHAVRLQIIKTSPFEYVEYVHNKNKPTLKKMDFWTLEEYKEFRSVITDFDDICLFDCLYYTGMRISELQARTWNDINWNTRELSIHSNYDTKNHRITQSTKNGTNRTIYLTKQLFNELKEKYAEDKNIIDFNDSCYIFGTYAPVPQKTVTNHKDNYIKKYNDDESHIEKLTRIRIHDFRHSHVSLLANNGVESWDIAERLGHSKQMVENRYAHMFPQRRKRVIDILDSLG